jgi:hypothetical protein
VLVLFLKVAGVAVRMLVSVLVTVWLGGFEAFINVKLLQLIVSLGAPQAAMCGGLEVFNRVGYVRYSSFVILLAICSSRASSSNDLTR